ncbi:hypothetical protein GGF31_004624 [Allomyces arbusculus]|nr:hypothetical protein GGF31_004624 [Allomyces arbusculus]
MLDGNITQTPAEEMNGFSMQYLNGAQVCRAIVRNFKIPAGFKALGSLVAAQRSDYIVAAQIVQRDVQYRVRCMDQSVMVDAAEQLKLDPSLRAEPRPILTMGLLSRWFGTDTVADKGFSDTHGGWVQIQLDAANSGGLVADGSSSYPSWTDPDGPQQYFMNAVRVGVWEVVASLVLMVTPIALGFARLPKLFDTIVMQLFLSPVSHAHEHASYDKRAALSNYPTDDDLLNRAMFVEDLTFMATLALVEYPAGMDPATAMAAPPDARPPAAFDVQFINASQRHVWTSFGPVPLPHRTSPSRPWSSRFTRRLSSLLRWRSWSCPHSLQWIEAQRGGSDPLRVSPLSFVGHEHKAWSMLDDVDLAPPRPPTVVLASGTDALVMPKVLMVSANCSAIKTAVEKRLRELDRLGVARDNGKQ